MGIRDGETALPFDPAETASDASIIFIGRIRSTWLKREDCPGNMVVARERGEPASVEIDVAWRQGLTGLERASHVVILSWMNEAQRNLIMQKPRHAENAQGTFSLRSPVRPNPVGLHVARLVSVDRDRGVLELDAIDVLDGTPVIDVKPYYASIDSIPEAVVAKA
jgi:tRNA-Thr(GGU) m(6)t(6)A37 methyltransferase TsaA